MSTTLASRRVRAAGFAGSYHQPVKTVLRLALVYPVVWFARVSAAAREWATMRAFERGTVRRTDHENDLLTVVELRKRADRLLMMARGLNAE